MSDDLNAPVAWLVSATKPSEYASASKPEVVESQSATKESADSITKRMVYWYKKTHKMTKYEAFLWLMDKKLGVP